MEGGVDLHNNDSINVTMPSTIYDNSVLTAINHGTRTTAKGYSVMDKCASLFYFLRNVMTFISCISIFILVYDRNNAMSETNKEFRVTRTEHVVYLMCLLF